MKRFVKITAIVLGTLIGLLIVGAIIVALVVDPNDYKDDITRAVKDATGRELTIHGKLKLSLFPWIGLETGTLELSNAAGFGKRPMVRVESTGIKAALLPLFRGQVEVGTVRLNGLEVNLAKDTAGRTNWDDLVKPKTPPAPKTPAAPAPSGPRLAALAVGGIDMRRANLHWHDQASDERISLRNFNLHTGRLAIGQPVRLHLDVELEQGKPPRRVPVALDATVTATEQELALRGIDLRLDDSRLTGTIQLALNQPVYRFDLALDQIDIDHYMPPTNAKPAAAPMAGGPGKPLALPLSTLGALNTQGELKIGRLKAMGLRSEDIRVRVNAKGGLITLGPNAAKLYGGDYKGTTTLDVRGREPRLRFNEALSNIDVGPFLRDAELFAHFDGIGNIALDLSAQGFDEQAIRRTLDGQVNIDFRKGKIVGVDLVKTANEVKTKIDQLRGKTTRVKPVREDVTAYDQLTATITLNQGVASNNDLRLVAPALHARGKGSANLVTERLDYRLETQLTKDAKASGLSIPVRVHGPFTALEYDVELGQVAKEAAKEKVKEKVKRKKEKLLERLLR